MPKRQNKSKQTKQKTKQNKNRKSSITKDEKLDMNK